MAAQLKKNREDFQDTYSILNSFTYLPLPG